MNLKSRASKWAEKNGDFIFDYPIEVKIMVERAWLAGYKAGKKDRKEIFCDNCELRK